ncbi:MAG: protein-L-isoaspartate(D-aspartate) O-methyltransferase, partial [Chloroflexi bacterium]|nr:protein-L-isoaspartate(D-aspartate) O-methyltransferase [Chloroflexota bacterium]
MSLTRLTVTLLLLSAFIVACGEDESDQPDPQTESAVLQDVEEDFDQMTPTFIPTEFIATPADLDREFDDTFEQEREDLVQGEVAAMVEDEAVLTAMQAVPRHSFVPTGLLSQAYRDFPLPIGYGQTISQPSLVGMMTELLELEPGDRVLEIGTGSGYQAAILREMTDEVYTVEIIPELAATARAVLDRLGYEDIHLDRRDGYFGWREHAPYDAIIVTAAPDHLPPYLVEQLDSDGGRMVIPIG